MTLPTAVIEWSPTTDPGTAPVWVDISASVRAFSTKMGRQNELDRFEAGTATIVLDNTDRTFDPKSNANCKPMRRFRIRATYSAVTYNLFSGFAQAYPQEWPLKQDAVCSVKLADGFKILNNKKINTSYAAQRSDLRIGAVADTCSWPAADRDLRTGQSTMQAATLTNGGGLQHIQDVVYGENGRVFIDGRGYIVFHDRHAPFVVTAMNTSQVTFGDGGGTELPYRELEPIYDDALIYNEVRVTRTGGVEQVVTDATSQTSYLTRTLVRSGLLISSDSEVSDAANYLLAKYKDPWYRFEAVTLSGTRDASLWAHMLGRAIGDRVTVKRRPPGGGSAISQDCWIEGIEHHVNIGRWYTTFRLSPADLVTYWVLGNATFGILNTNTRLGY